VNPDLSVVDRTFFASRRNILVLGYGISGKSLYTFLKSEGHNVLVHDDNIPDIPDKADLDNLNQFDIIVKSPSIPFMSHNGHPIVRRAVLSNIPVISTFDAFVLHNPDARIIGITGTNGKSTTTALTYHIMKDAGIDVQMGGNIGIPYFTLPKSYIYLFELSSYELASSKHLKLEVGCLLNIEPDHLSFHGNFENYRNAKRRILDASQTKIISFEDKWSIGNYGGTDNVLTVSSEYQTQAAVYVCEHSLMVGTKNLILDLSGLLNLMGQHNYQNIGFAYTICRHFGIPNHIISKGVKTFHPLPHRLNIVKKIGDILFINDSKATNPESAARALATFVGYKIYWLVGGRSKKTDAMSAIARYLGSVQKIFLFGEATDEFQQMFVGIKTTVDCQTLATALHAAYNEARKESGPSVVLLSPMCASFDQFDDFEHRGNTFVEIVMKLEENAESGNHEN
jgi:UDP-N-acetylmuramoylalanine--D-glutamate ligase